MNNGNLRTRGQTRFPAELKQPFGPESRDALQRLVAGREVTADITGYRIEMPMEGWSLWAGEEFARILN